MTSLPHKLEEAAKNLPNTDAQWRVVSDHPVYGIAAGDYRIVQTPNQNNVRHYGPSDTWHGIPSIAYAEYIALCSPANVLALLSERNALAEQVAQMKDALENAREVVSVSANLNVPSQDWAIEVRAGIDAALSAPPSEAEKAARQAGYVEGMKAAAEIARKGEEASDPLDDHESTIMVDFESGEEVADAILATLEAGNG